MKTRILLVSICWVGYNAEAQQMPQYSQYVFNALHINPAYAGYKIDPFVQATYRSQFVDFPGSPETFSVSADMASENERMGYGAMLLSDRIGATRTQTAMATYSYRIQLKERAFLGFGLSAGATEYMLDGSMFQPDDPSDAGIPTGRINMFTPNLNAGLFFHSDSWFAGLSVFNLVGKRNLENEDIALSVHRNHYFFQLGTLIHISEMSAFKPSILIREDFNSPTSFDINAMMLFHDRVWAGGAFRSNIGSPRGEEVITPQNRTALVGLLDVFVTENLRFGYAYDFNLSQIHNFRNNSHEISLGYYLGNRTSPSSKCF
ncbi:PorP/SprF family type IX secretion system membrane protein [Pleomorphovibrio marinus]|uniref:PorP/SprF family type IX secretion system membrane protein n=1 Tax=Pleomorphovibrio marinus TaxID=2164132 RepID=UPI001E2CD251|nr:type IX secretion system membrane protein PorP/SprF [Pleomorphovibrio marinus]